MDYLQLLLSPERASGSLDVCSSSSEAPNCAIKCWQPEEGVSIWGRGNCNSNYHPFASFVSECVGGQPEKADRVDERPNRDYPAICVRHLRPVFHSDHYSQLDVLYQAGNLHAHFCQSRTNLQFSADGMLLGIRTHKIRIFCLKVSLCTFYVSAAAHLRSLQARATKRKTFPHPEGN